MEKKLYRVKVCLYVMAENEYDACWAATNSHFDIFECVADKAKTIEPGWEDAVPYNSDDDRTCSEILGDKMRVAHRSGTRLNRANRLWAVRWNHPIETLMRKTQIRPSVQA